MECPVGIEDESIANLPEVMSMQEQSQYPADLFTIFLLKNPSLQKGKKIVSRLVFRLSNRERAARVWKNVSDFFLSSTLSQDCFLYRWFFGEQKVAVNYLPRWGSVRLSGLEEGYCGIKKEK